MIRSADPGWLRLHPEGVSESACDEREGEPRASGTWALTGKRISVGLEPQVQPNRLPKIPNFVIGVAAVDFLLSVRITTDGEAFIMVRLGRRPFKKLKQGVSSTTPSAYQPRPAQELVADRRSYKSIQTHSVLSSYSYYCMTNIQPSWPL